MAPKVLVRRRKWACSTHVFKRLSFLLHGIVAAASTVDFDLCGLDFSGLSRALTFHQRTFYAKASTGGDEFEQFAVKLLNVGHNLHVLDGRSVVEGDELTLLLPRRVRTQPLTQTSVPKSVRCSSSFIFVLFISLKVIQMNPYATCALLPR